MDFLSADEEERLMNGIDEMIWDSSQSGRRKQVIRSHSFTSF
jgi:alkylated DNA repair protein alkB family protein 4